MHNISLRRVARFAAPRRTFGGAGGSGKTNNTLELFERVRSLQRTILAPLNVKLLGPLEKAADQLVPLPLVFVLGNHSSGKSTFINYVLGRRIQETGVAPTDDGFTLISAGNADQDQDGPSLVGDPNLGFGGLAQFGSALVSHVSLKVRTGLNIRNLMLVDSPGMIDAPVTPVDSGDAARRSGISGSASDRSRDRGYDFEGCVKWLAEKADVILLFQDPQKPGTTGETMTVMTSALLGQTHKLHIILNKADTLTSVHDFGRAYGALCWNLSKVINRKDLPRIYTMSVPQAADAAGAAAGPAAASGFLREALPDLERTRNEIVAEVLRAPARRIDNVTTQLNDSAQLLRMHAVVLNAVRKEYAMEVTKHAAAAVIATLGAGSLAGAALVTGLPQVAAPLAVLTLGVSGLGYWYTGRTASAKSAFLVDGPGLDEAFRRTHFLQIASRDESVLQLWERARGPLRSTLRAVGIWGVPTAKRSEIAALDKIISRDVPELRSAATKAGSLLD